MTIRIRIVGAAQNFNLYLHRRKLSALFGCWLLAPAYLNATVVIALIHPDAIYIAADSRKTMTNERDSVMGISTTCKIHVVNGIAFAAAGLDSFDTIFNLRDVITAALQTSGYPRLTNKLVLLDRNLRTALAAPIREIKINIPSLYSRLQTDGPIVEAVFATWSSGVPALRKDAWTVTSDGTLTHETPFPKIGGNIVILGDGEMSVADYMRTHPGWNAPPAQAMLDRLIRAAIEAAKRDPELQVGGEVSIVKLTAKGTQWLRHGDCR